jgi:hypothetical protein
LSIATASLAQAADDKPVDELVPRVEAADQAIDDAGINLEAGARHTCDSANRPSAVKRCGEVAVVMSR